MKGDWDGAIADFTAAIKLISQPSGAPHRRREGWRANDLRGTAAFNSAPYTVIDPHAALTYAARGLAHLGKKDYAAAISDFDQALRISPRLCEAYFYRGNARFEMRDYAGAISDYDRALRINSDMAEAINNRGNARYHRGDLRGALADLDRAIFIHPRVAAFYYNRGKARREAGDFDGALEPVMNFRLEICGWTVWLPQPLVTRLCRQGTESHRHGGRRRKWPENRI